MVGGNVDRVVVVAHEPIARRGLRLVFQDAGIAALDAESLERAARLSAGRTGVVLVVLAAELGAEEAASVDALRRAQPEVAVCFVVDAVDAEALTMLTGDDGLGVVLGRFAEIDHIIDVVQAVAAGRVVIPRGIQARSPRPDDSLGSLTPSEHEVLELLAEGLRNPAIARRLWKSEKAIEKTVARVFRKLGLDADAMPDLDRRVTAARIFLSASLGVSGTAHVAARPRQPGPFPHFTRALERGREAALRGRAPFAAAEPAR
jgi:DNA-binding NarL/FixJ family response regulator